MANTAAITAPAPTLITGSGGVMSLSLPMPGLLAAGGDASHLGFKYTLTMPTLVASAGGNAALTGPSPTLAMTATFPGIGAAGITAPAATLSSAGTVSGMGHAALTFGTTSSTYSLVGFSGAVISTTISGQMTVLASGTAGVVGSAAITLPLYDLLNATGSTQNYGGMDLLMPAAQLGATAQAWITAPGALMVAVGSATVATTYEAYVVNLNHTPKPREIPVDEVTRYTNYPFDRVVRYKNSYYGMNSTGLYLLEGTTDAAAPIPFEAKTTLMDMGTEQKKTVEVAYFGGRFGPAATVTLYVGESGSQPYSYSTPRDTTAQNYRQPFGRGIKTRYFALGVAGSGALTIDSISFNIAKLARKV